MQNLSHRAPAVSGSFYPSDSHKLQSTLDQLFAIEEELTVGKIKALIVPHAGYKYSGSIAAKAYNTLSAESNYKRVFILASAHSHYFKGVSVAKYKTYQTPLKSVNVDVQLVDELIANHQIFGFNHQAHQNEHTIEVQLPFLVHKLSKPFSIVPLLIGDVNSNDIGKIANALEPYFNDENLFVISTDFSHYPPYKVANNADANTADAICTGSNAELHKAIERNAENYGSDLKTSTCGLNAISCLLNLTGKDQQLEYKKIAYQNSGDVSGADKSGVVGYWAIAVHKTDEKFMLTKKEEHWLIQQVRGALNSYFNNAPIQETTEIPRVFLNNMGVFVTLRIKKQLRACIGRFTSNKPLYKLVQKVAISAARDDNRFEGISLEELCDLNFEISLLSPLERIYDINEIQLGKHGIYLVRDMNKGTLLPEVAINNNWDTIEFLNYCSKHKMGLKENAWLTSEIYIYTSTKIYGDFIP